MQCIYLRPPYLFILYTIVNYNEVHIIVESKKQNIHHIVPNYALVQPLDRACWRRTICSNPLLTLLTGWTVVSMSGDMAGQWYLLGWDIVLLLGNYNQVGDQQVVHQQGGVVEEVGGEQLAADIQYKRSRLNQFVCVI